MTTAHAAQSCEAVAEAAFVAVSYAAPSAALMRAKHLRLGGEVGLDGGGRGEVSRAALASPMATVESAIWHADAASATTSERL